MVWSHALSRLLFSVITGGALSRSSFGKFIAFLTTHQQSAAVRSEIIAIPSVRLSVQHALVLVHGQVTIIFVVTLCLSVCLFVQSFSQPSLIRFRSKYDICYMSGSSYVP